MLRELTRQGALLDLSLVNRIVDEVAIKGHLGNSDCEVVEFKIISSRRKTATKISALAMRSRDFRMLGKLVVKSPGKLLPKVLGPISAGHFLTVTSYHLLRAQEHEILKCWKS